MGGLLAGNFGRHSRVEILRGRGGAIELEFRGGRVFGVEAGVKCVESVEKSIGRCCERVGVGVENRAGANAGVGATKAFHNCPKFPSGAGAVKGFQLGGEAFPASANNSALQACDRGSNF